MRKSLLLLLLATVPAPSFATGDEDRRNAREAARAERAERRDARQDRGPRVEAREERRIERSDSLPAPRSVNVSGGDGDRAAPTSVRTVDPFAESSFGVERAAAREQRRESRLEDKAPRTLDVSRHRAAELETDEEREQRMERLRRRIERASTSDDGSSLMQSRERRAPSPAGQRDRFERPDIEQRRQASETVGGVRRSERLRAERPSLLERPGARPPRLPIRKPPQARPDIPAPLPATARSSVSARPWHSEWRRDSRYDWYRWRSRNRWLFSLGFYFDPFGWGYRRYPIGWRMWPSYYDVNYWLHDPWMWRLPPAYGPYRWVRYWDDALLVNVYTGEVVDVVHNFFW